MKRLLLLSNSTLPREPYLGWPKDHIDAFLGETRKVLFIPFAAVGFTYDKYEEMVQNALSEKGIEVTSIHHAADPVKAIENAESIFIGGGNTFHLLYQLQTQKLVEPIRRKVDQGTPYAGWSAGGNMACPTIKTTNDMPIIEPLSFDALHLIDFQINPHYTEKTIDGHGGESRLQRLKEFCAINDTPIVCLPEGCGIKVMGDEMTLIGKEEVKVLNSETEVIKPGLFHL